MCVRQPCGHPCGLFGSFVSAFSVERHTSLDNTTCSRLSTVRFATGPKRSMGHVMGAEKIFFLFRDVDGPAMAPASVESCRCVVMRSPRGRLGSLLDVGNRLRRMRGRFNRWIHISTGPQPGNLLEHKSDNLSIQSSRESPKNRRMRPRRLPDPRPIPEGVQEPICPRKK